MSDIYNSHGQQGSQLMLAHQRRDQIMGQLISKADRILVRLKRARADKRAYRICDFRVPVSMKTMFPLGFLTDSNCARLRTLDYYLIN